jgi:hypothetical protein
MKKQELNSLAYKLTTYIVKKHAEHVIFTQRSACSAMRTVRKLILFHAIWSYTLGKKSRESNNSIMTYGVIFWENARNSKKYTTSKIKALE